MRKIPVIQYLPLTRPLASRGLIKKLNAANVHSILDLEDSAQNIFDKEETRQLKKDARNGLLSMSDLFDYSITTNIREAVVSAVIVATF